MEWDEITWRSLTKEILRREGAPLKAGPIILGGAGLTAVGIGAIASIVGFLGFLRDKDAPGSKAWDAVTAAWGGIPLAWWVAISASIFAVGVVLYGAAAQRIADRGLKKKSADAKLAGTKRLFVKTIRRMGETVGKSASASSLIKQELSLPIKRSLRPDSTPIGHLIYLTNLSKEQKQDVKPGKSHWFDGPDNIWMLVDRIEVDDLEDSFDPDLWCWEDEK